ncbi:HAD-IB family phosphatase [Candidatus Saccharibacteria bacterium]|nr:HAD-IB family phosphatase [Candidatus Saccharibacteria bacterium]
MNQEKPTNTIFIFDFDSTFCQLEALDALAQIVLADAPDRTERVAAIEAITSRGMNGEIGFGESLQQRFEQLHPTKSHIEELIIRLNAAISPSFLAHKDFIRHHAETTWIISGGFKDLIVPVVREFGIYESHVLANTFIWSSDGQTITGYDHSNPLSQDDGKLQAVKALNFPTNVHTIMVGDGMTDYSIREEGLVDEFVAFTETIAREPVIAVADRVANSFDQLLLGAAHATSK